jgi:hypothetical protein
MADNLPALPITQQALKQMLDAVFASEAGVASYLLVAFSTPGGVPASEWVTNEPDNSVTIAALEAQIQPAAK